MIVCLKRAFTQLVGICCRIFLANSPFRPGRRLLVLRGQEAARNALHHFSKSNNDGKHVFVVVLCFPDLDDYQRQVLRKQGRLLRVSSNVPPKLLSCEVSQSFSLQRHRGSPGGWKERQKRVSRRCLTWKSGAGRCERPLGREERANGGQDGMENLLRKFCK